MSSKELLSYLKGNTISREITSRNGVTNAPDGKVFFFDDKINVVSDVTNKTYVIEPLEAYDFMFGISKYDFLVKFSSNIEMSISKGRYANTIDSYGFFDTMTVEERFIDSYNTETLTLEEVIDLRCGSFGIVDFASLLDDSFFDEVKDND